MNRRVPSCHSMHDLMPVTKNISVKKKNSKKVEFNTKARHRERERERNMVDVEEKRDSNNVSATPLPILAPGKFYGDQLGAVNMNMFSGGGRQQKGPDYLSYKPRPAMERMVYNTGISYLGGTAVGGIYGLVHGARNSPSPRLRIRVNTMLNGITTYGSKVGNGIGVLGTSCRSFLCLLLFDSTMSSAFHNLSSSSRRI